MSRHAARWIALLAAIPLLGLSCSDEAPTGPGGSASGTGGAGASGGGPGGGGSGGGAGGAKPATFEPGEERPGGDTTIDSRDEKSFLRPAANLSLERLGTFEAGLALFDVAWTVGGEVDRDGLGPTYVGTSCRSCHFRGGRGAPPPPGQPMTSMLVRLSIPSEDGAAFVPDPRYGDQIQNKAIPGVLPEGWFSVAYEAQAGAYADGASYELLAPAYTAHDLAFGPLAENTRLSPRVAQPMIGLGLLAAIRDEDIEALADPSDANGDGIRGRRNHVSIEGALSAGRFGWKANEVDLARQTAGAFLGDIGITSPLHPTDNCPPLQAQCAAAAGTTQDIDPARFDAIVLLSHLVAVPHRPDAANPDVLLGKALFSQAGCSGCHTPSFITGPLAGFPELEGQHIYPYTDLLIHDMGPGLADERPDQEAGGRDFRTAPLWGIGMTNLISGHTRLLHDGRARSIEEAILWHGGEAEAAREGFRALDAAGRAALLRFVSSL
ncbi:di-heme oxidoredictase family protein [Polyangium sp. 6x1]|uniref:di-heme oxidoreductase family protein n=1 Tax=Polyangium sp. 6x1 TaxID=3042689 RepID=UPI0024831460|nr:di-heme oxidoredictase family protein [Polyangium sp. 6x1]MDI1452067.1 di-heme oxidoredictase family protein [Polyangium sp. 6x1]